MHIMQSSAIYINAHNHDLILLILSCLGLYAIGYEGNYISSIEIIHAGTDGRNRDQN